MKTESHSAMLPLKRLHHGLLAALFVLSAFASPSAQADHNGTDGALDQGTQQQDLEDQLNDYWLITLPEMADQFSATMIHQIFGVGAMLDAKHQLESQRLLGQLRAEAHKNYASSEQMCRYGTNVKSLAATEELAKANKQILTQIMVQRETLRGRGLSETGRGFDKRNRYEHFRTMYCNPEDNNGEMWNASFPQSSICRTAAGSTRINNDIDFTRMLDTRMTLDVNFTDTALTNDEQDILALSRNLYAHELFVYKDEDLLNREKNILNVTEMRTVHALRGIARNSFAEIVGMKAAGTGTVGPFMRRMIEELGVAAADINQFLGVNPSYFAQMEVLTRRMYHNQNFYTNLYTTPENLKRTSAALLALQIMHDRDRFEASLRREMLLSGILELRLRDTQEVLESDTTGRSNTTTGN
ncbi:MAG: hypothetical protein HYS17_01230 [Micavibrio aeruginosavorus]|uniref:Uncharacterized protein n=1 Tax=Micavibrio aeruginosavorus TaxID=349221 RepID=A0A7T5R2N0_9BACT|nr:MAG: hypothetical protein HYS17_01230 [Micavibrio aeruginosavorus]